MPHAIPPAVRQAIRQRRDLGHSAREIATDLQLPCRTVRHLLRALRTRGEQALQPRYARCGCRSERDTNPLYRQTLDLRAQHPRWGAGRIRLQLAKQASAQALPSERTLQRWLRSQQRPPAPAGRPKEARRERSSVVHEVWQVDAGEQKRLANGQPICWLRVVEECSGAVLQTVVFPLRPFQLRATLPGPAAFSPDFPGLGPTEGPAGR